MSLGSTKLTPMMKQWHDAKNMHHDAILLFRMGDFYELFGEDAVAASPILNLTLTSRDKDKSGLKMAGFPFHAADNYINKLIEHGHKVAICEQLEDPKLKVGVVKRGITNVITPGTAIDHDSAAAGDLAFLLSIVSYDGGFALCALDYATATFKVTSGSADTILDEALRYAPRELVVLDNDSDASALAQKLKTALGSRLRIEVRAQALFKVSQAMPSNLTLQPCENTAASLIVSYVLELKGQMPPHISSPKRYSIEQQLLMDEATRTNLDLLPRKRGDACNLFSVLDDTKTMMGKRALLQAIKAPSTSIEDINGRLTQVCELVSNGGLRGQLREVLGRFYDLDKLVALLASNKITPRALGSLRECLLAIEAAVQLVVNASATALNDSIKTLPSLLPLQQHLVDLVVAEPPLVLKEGGVFCPGIYPELDELRDIMANGHKMLLDLETREREQTSIPSLKIKYTRVFGYYIEITKTHLEKVPKSYLRKQTVANGERYTTEELSVLESKINSAESQALLIEELKFNELCEYAKTFVAELMSWSRVVAHLDLVASFAETAQKRQFVKPQVCEADARILDIRGGRHPIVEELCQKDGVYFVPNDTVLNQSDCSLMLITGPNMAGKSTIMRQAALIQIMAQIGSFVPAKSATLSICDAIFARVGASDDISTKRSTFMVEMTETAAILHNASINSLIVLDEIGRGTSTYDGLSIAQAVAEYIHDHVKSRTLFATHYHELTGLEQSLSNLKNFHVEIDEKPDRITFLYTLAQGPCLKSFGIEVARISGLPNYVLERAQSILDGLEAKDGALPKPPIPDGQIDVRSVQPDLFGKTKKALAFTGETSLVDAILGMDINRLTPLQALNKLAVLQQTLRKVC
jgi:DNA mismatch repair protein MutS